MMFNLFDYCESLARKLKDINHTDDVCKYFRATEQTELQELEQNISNVSGTIMIAIDGQISSYQFNLSDNLIEMPSFSIIIAQPTSVTDTATIFKAQQRSKEIMHQVISKMLHDARAYKHGCDLIDPNSFLLEGFGPIGSGFYGVLLSFQLKEGVRFELNKDFWQ